MTDLIPRDLIDLTDQEPVTDRSVFRLRTTAFHAKGRVVLTKELRLMKRLSMGSNILIEDLDNVDAATTLQAR